MIRGSDVESTLFGGGGVSVGDFYGSPLPINLQGLVVMVVTHKIMSPKTRKILVTYDH